VKNIFIFSVKIKMLNLPNDIILEIADHLDINTIQSLMKTSKKFQIVQEKKDLLISLQKDLLFISLQLDDLIKEACIGWCSADYNNYLKLKKEDKTLETLKKPIFDIIYNCIKRNRYNIGYKILILLVKNYNLRFGKNKTNQNLICCLLPSFYELKRYEKLYLNTNTLSVDVNLCKGLEKINITTKVSELIKI
jgi:hypothetical protein